MSEVPLYLVNRKRYLVKRGTINDGVACALGKTAGGRWPGIGFQKASTHSDRWGE